MTTVRQITSALKKEFGGSHLISPSMCIVMQTPHTLKIVTFVSSITGGKYCSITDRPLFNASSTSGLMYGSRINNPNGSNPFWHLGVLSTSECVSYIIGSINSSLNDLDALNSHLGQRVLQNCRDFTLLLDVAIYKALTSKPNEAISSLTKLEDLDISYEWQTSTKQSGIELKKIMSEQDESHVKGWITKRENNVRAMFGL